MTTRWFARSASVAAGAVVVSSAPVAAGPTPEQVRPGWVVVGDMIVPETIMPSNVASAGSIDLWPNGEVIYTFDPNVNASNQAAALAAMAELEGTANISFVPRTNETDYVRIEAGSANFSYLGMAGGEQPLQITSWQSNYVIVHELMHALGFIHEHQRTDRDQYIEINWDNVDPAFMSAYAIFNLAQPVTPYDFQSVMHYSECAFTVCDCQFSCNFCNTPGFCDTITVPWPNDAHQDTIGQLSFLSAGDIAGLQYLYGISDCNNNQVHDFFDVDAGTSQDCNGNGFPDECELAMGSVDDCNNNSVPDLCEANSDCNGNGVSDWCDIDQGASLDLDLNDIPDECDVPPVIRVDPGATGLGDGSTWADAATDLQAALVTARTAPNVVTEIWLRAGTHRPAGAGGDRDASFELVNDLEIYGGFSGTETMLAQRNPTANPTVLSGDLDGDDGPGFANRGDNARQVVTAPAFTLPTAILDGVVIAGGNADGIPGFPDPGTSVGGGLYVLGRPTVRGCVFEDNQSDAGAGGGVFAWVDSRPLFDGCTFRNNRAGIGGGVYNDGGDGTWVNCLFVGNEATPYHGGAFASRFGDFPLIANCTVVGNTAADSTGGIYHLLSGITNVVNCIAWGNTDLSGSGESAQIAIFNGGTLEVDHSIVQGWTGALGGTANSGTDPLFVDAPGGDLRLSSSSPAIDAADNDAIPNGITTDLDGLSRFVDDPNTTDTGAGTAPIADRGAFEFRPLCPGDTDGSGAVDIDDVVNVILDFGTDGSANGGDVDGSGLVDIDDVVLVVLNFGPCI